MSVGQPVEGDTVEEIADVAVGALQALERIATALERIAPAFEMIGATKETFADGALVRIALALEKAQEERV